MLASRIFVGILFFVFGAGLIGLYVRVARRRFGVQLDPVQAILYRVDHSKLSGKDRALEFVLGMLKHVGLVMAVISLAVVFSG